MVDTVWLPSRGTPLSRGDVIDAYREVIIPLATLVTPNAQEAALLAEQPVRSLEEARRAAESIAVLGARAVLVKGGHLEGDARGTDILFLEGEHHQLSSTDVVPGRFHGTGCALSAAIATHLAFDEGIQPSVTQAKTWLTAGLRHAFAVGKDALPVNHLWAVEDEP